MWNRSSGLASRGPLGPFRCRLVVALLACWALAGCSGQNKARITSAPTARQALEAALDAWKAGKAAGKIDSVTPPVQVVDSVWARGTKLDNYEILSEGTEPDGVRSFSVRVKTKLDKEGLEIRYIVQGQNPVYVYRYEDYKRSQDWQGLQK